MAFGGFDRSDKTGNNAGLLQNRSPAYIILV
jgi:hypothetical protein